jgi:hypothetical protein
MRPWYAVLAVLVGALSAGAVVACGGDDAEPIVPVTTQTTESEALSQADFIDEIDDVCAEANVAIANLTETSATGTSSQIADEREIVEGELDQIQDLEAPSEDEATLDDFIDSLEQLLENLESQELAAQREDTAGLAELEAEESTIRGELLSAADEYGFKDCGQEGEATTTDTGTGATGTGTEAAPVAPEPAPVPVEPAPAPVPDTGGTGGGTGGTGTGGTGGTGGISP